MTQKRNGRGDIKSVSIPRPKGTQLAWQRAIRTAPLGPREKLVALMLSTHMKSTGDDAYPRVSTLADECGYTNTKPVHAALRELERAGWLEIIRRKGTSSIYRAIFPADYIEELGRETTQPHDADEDGQVVELHTVGQETSIGGGEAAYPRTTPLTTNSTSAPAPAPETPAQALAKLRLLVTDHKAWKDSAFAGPEGARLEVEARFKDESNRLLRICAQEPEAELVAA